MLTFFVVVRQNLEFAAGSPLQPVPPIFKFKRPEASIPLISNIFVCYSIPFCFYQDFDVKNTNFFNVHQDLVYAPDFPSGQVQPFFKVKRSLKRAYPLFHQFLCAITHHFYCDPDYDVKNA